MNSLKVVVLLQDGKLVAQCLDYDIAVQAKNAKTLLKLLYLNLITRTARALMVGAQPFAGMARAPQAYWDMYDRAVRTSFELDLELPPGTPPNARPPLEIRVA